MIPIKPEPEAVEYYVRNIISVWSVASQDQFDQGQYWYEQAHQTARTLADGDVKTGAGLLAALSPQTAWWLNVELACDAYEAGNATRHTTDSTSKANRILAGEDPESVLPMQRKTGQFYRCILDPGDEAPVCIDRHAYDIAVGIPLGDWNRGLSSHGRYALLAYCYREAAQRVGRIPSVVQAVTWVTWRDSIGTRA